MTGAHTQETPASRFERVGGILLITIFLSPFGVRLYELGLGEFLHRVMEWALASGWPWIHAPRGALILGGAIVFAASSRASSHQLRVAMLIIGFGLLLPTFLGTGSSVAPTDLLQMSLLLGVSVLMGIIQAAGPEAVRRAL